MGVYRDKIVQARNFMLDADFDAWMIIGHETATNIEPTFKLISDSEMIGMTAIIFNKNKTSTVICTPLDQEGYKLNNDFDEVIAFSGSFNEALKEYCLRNNIKIVALNYSEQDPGSDGLAYGVYLSIKPVFDSLKIEIVSAQTINRRLRSQKTERELQLIKFAATETARIIEDLGSQMRTSMTLLDVKLMFHEYCDRLKYGYSWAKHHNPGVACALSPIGHGGRDDLILTENTCVNIDFGLRINNYSSDLQRMFYIVDDTNQIPIEVAKGFSVVVEAIEIAKKSIKPGVTGREIDEITRRVLTENGYETYHCATGHEVGMFAHDGGMLLAGDKPGVDRKDLIDKPLLVGQVFTIEPYVVTKYGRIGVEEMIVVTETGCEFIVKPQKQLYVLKGGTS